MVAIWSVHPFQKEKVLLQPENSLRITTEEAMARTGVKLWSFTPNNIDPEIENTFSHRFDITLTDSVLTNRPLGELSQSEYEQELERYERPHFHYTDELRFIHAGKCCYDVITTSSSPSAGEWIRVELTGGDAILLPTGTFHCVRLRLEDGGINVTASGYYQSMGYSNEYVPIFEVDQSLPLHKHLTPSRVILS